MSVIRRLSPIIANQIAAGEVVERPCSVVKELVENAIDAGATAVTVEVRGGGSEYIRVADNGSGIPSEQVALAFERHSTSKIATTDDLFHISTLGFRGEALASIAAVSKVTVRTRSKDEEVGTLCRVFGGDVLETSGCGCPNGSTFTVEELFYNVPARLKFLKSARAESALVSDYIGRIIIANPNVAIKYINGDKTVFQSSGDGSLLDACLCVYGRELRTGLIPIEFDDGYLKIEGYIGRESLARANRNQQTFIVNDRYIKSVKISFAVQRAYDMRLMVGRFPFYALRLYVSSRELDVNVHPNKLEVRFRNEDRVVGAVYASVKEALSSFPASDIATVSEVNNVGRAPDIHQPNDRGICFERTKDPFSRSAPSGLRLGDSGGYAFRQAPYGAVDSSVPVFRVPAPFLPEVDEAGGASEQLSFSDDGAVIVGCLFDTYWVVQSGDSVFLIDQHAAHERVLFERFFNCVKAASQRLLVPDVVRLSPTDYALIADSLEVFASLGYELELLDGLDVSVVSVPVVLGKSEGRRYLLDAVDMLSSLGAASSEELKRSRIIQSACKHAVKADDKLSVEEIRALLGEFSDGDVPLTCPHGRPIAVRYRKKDIEKAFGRIV